jgi:SNF2 family DNA or RNA helicase
MLNMSRLEDLAFNCINTTRSAILGYNSSGAKRFAADRAFLPQMSKILDSPQHSELSEVYNDKNNLRRYIPQRLTKVVALRKSLAEQRRIDPVIRAVVFTQFLDVHSACVRGLQGDGFDVYQFTGSSSTNQRDIAIRSFQDVSIPRPAVFVITLRSGNVGITLTAASRVYLMEPNLDPAVEVQAAGRIHRLGQDKPCHVVKFAFNNSYESNVIDLHTEINAGRISIIDGFVPPEAWRILTRGLRFRTKDD